MWRNVLGVIQDDWLKVFDPGNGEINSFADNQLGMQCRARKQALPRPSATRKKKTGQLRAAAPWPRAVSPRIIPIINTCNIDRSLRWTIHWSGSIDIEKPWQLMAADGSCLILETSETAICWMFYNVLIDTVCICMYYVCMYLLCIYYVSIMYVLCM